MPKTELLRKVSDFLVSNHNLFILDSKELKWEDGINTSKTDYDGEPIKTFDGVLDGFGNSVEFRKYELSRCNSVFKKCLCGVWFEQSRTAYWHQRECIGCMEKLKEIRTDLFDDLIEYYKSCKKVINAEIWEKYDIQTKSKKISSINSIAQKDDTGLVQAFLHNSAIAQSVEDFPDLRGVYLVRFLNNDKWNALYVGRSENLKERWKQHHRMPEIELLKKIGIQLEFRYIAETPLVKLNGTIEDIESQLINTFKPKLNRTNALILSA